MSRKIKTKGIITVMGGRVLCSRLAYRKVSRLLTSMRNRATAAINEIDVVKTAVPTATIVDEMIELRPSIAEFQADPNIIW